MAVKVAGVDSQRSGSYLKIPLGISIRSRTTAPAPQNTAFPPHCCSTLSWSKNSCGSPLQRALRNPVTSLPRFLMLYQSRLTASAFPETKLPKSIGHDLDPSVDVLMSLSDIATLYNLVDRLMHLAMFCIIDTSHVSISRKLSTYPITASACCMHGLHWPSPIISQSDQSPHRVNVLCWHFRWRER